MIYKEKNLGITLIALVVTIIVLLLLAGISLSMLTGSNGLLSKATKAGEDSIIGEEKERVAMAYNGALTEKYKTDINAIVTADDVDRELKRNDSKADAEYETEEGENKGKIKVTFNNGHVYYINLNGEIILVTTSGGGNGNESSRPGNPDPITEIFGETSTINGEDPSPENPPIPKGFKPSENEDEDEVTEGRVILDDSDNEYVWIPVFEKTASRDWGADYTAVDSTTEGTDAYYSAIESALKVYTNTYADSSYTDEWYGSEATGGNYGYYAEEDTEKTNLIYYTNGNMTQTEYTDLYNNMLESVYKNGGFYIGRYEMGIGVVSSTAEAQTIARTSDSKEYTATYINTNNQAPTVAGMSTPISKPNAVPYNYVTQSQAQMLAKKLEANDVYASIMFGVQWNAVCVYIEHCDTNSQKPTNTPSNWLNYSTYSKLWGNYKSSTFTMNRGFYSTTSNSNPVAWNSAANKTSSGSWLCTTGASEQNKSLNIYDFAGNLYEWTLERNSYAYDSCVARGGNFFDNVEGSASYRRLYVTYHSDCSYASRLTLYIK